ncbi:site-2 protease family protein [Candidatus Berkelbacteria bacterium]|nr:site-2 protease family protein [Candidatus Berkelbacteria bacterium]
MELLIGIIIALIVLVSLSIHEYAHALVASLFGDDTAKHAGRLTLNPIAHWDNVGTTLLVGLIILRSLGLALPVFGWGKPVPIDEGKFENPRWSSFNVAIAGPMSNFVIAFILAVIYKLTDGGTFIDSILILSVNLNVFLGLFNLLPIAPLDGSKLLRLFIPEELYINLHTNPLLFYGMILLVFWFLLTPLQIFAQNISQFLLG